MVGSLYTAVSVTVILWAADNKIRYVDLAYFTKGNPLQQDFKEINCKSFSCLWIKWWVLFSCTGLARKFATLQNICAKKILQRCLIRRISCISPPIRHPEEGRQKTSDKISCETNLKNPLMKCSSCFHHLLTQKWGVVLGKWKLQKNPNLDLSSWKLLAFCCIS